MTVIWQIIKTIFRARNSNLAKSLTVQDVFFTATVGKFTHKLPLRRTSEKSNFFPHHNYLVMKKSIIHVMKIEYVSVGVNVGQTGKKGISFVSCTHGTIKLHFL